MTLHAPDPYRVERAAELLKQGAIVKRGPPGLVRLVFAGVTQMMTTRAVISAARPDQPVLGEGTC